MSQVGVLFAASCALLFLASLQHFILQSQHRARYALAVGNTALIACCNVSIAHLAPGASSAALVAYVLGAPLGVLASMWTADRLRTRVPMAADDREPGGLGLAAGPPGAGSD